MRHRRAFCITCKSIIAGCRCDACRFEVRYGICEDCKEPESREPEKRVKTQLRVIEGANGEKQKA